MRLFKFDNKIISDDFLPVNIDLHACRQNHKYFDPIVIFSKILVVKVKTPSSPKDALTKNIIFIACRNSNIFATCVCVQLQSSLSWLSHRFYLRKEGQTCKIQLCWYLDCKLKLFSRIFWSWDQHVGICCNSQSRGQNCGDFQVAGGHTLGSYVQFFLGVDLRSVYSANPTKLIVGRQAFFKTSLTQNDSHEGLLERVFWRCLSSDVKIALGRDGIWVDDFPDGYLLGLKVECVGLC